MKKVAMIGVGKLGQDCAEVMADAGYNVVGYDVEPRLPMFPMKGTIEEAVKDRDFIFIAAPTPHDPIYGGETPTSHLPNKDFDYTIVTDILKEVNKHVNKSQLVVLISTVLPGTVRRILEPCITNARFIYNPYLIAMGTVKWDMVNPEMVIIGTQDGSLTGDASELIDFYKVFMENDPRYEVGTWDEAESIKIFYNTFISAKLALVNMIQDVAETNGNINVDVVTTALAKSTHRIMGPAYMKAGLGDAGACHPRDNIALRYLADRLDLRYDLFDSIMSAREVQAERMAKRCLEYGKNVTIIGKAYKPSVPYTNGSASMLVGHYIEKHGGTVHFYDLNTGDTELREDWTEVYLIGYWDNFVESITLNNPACVLIDPWRKATSGMHTGEIIHYGNSRSTRDNTHRIPSEVMAAQTVAAFPELEQYLDNVHFIDATISSNKVFITRDTVDICREISNAYRQGKTRFFFYMFTEAMMPHIVRKIQRIAHLFEGMIPTKDFVYLSGAMNGEEAYQEIVKKYNFKNEISVISSNMFHYYLQSSVKGYEFPKEFVVKAKPKKFLCFNKVNREQRMRLVDKMLEHDFVKLGYYSFEGSHEGGIQALIDMLPKDKYLYLQKHRDMFPMRLNITQERSNPVNIIPDDFQYFENSYFSIVNETLFYEFDQSRAASIPFHQPFVENSSVFLSEKTFKCLAMMHPFVMFGRPNMLRGLRNAGFKTFAPLINEDYDTIQNDDERFNAVFAEVSRLVSLSESEWIDMQHKLKPILEHNQQRFFNSTQYGITQDISKLFVEEDTVIVQSLTDDVDWTLQNTTLASGIQLQYPTHLDGGGIQMKDDLIEVIKKTGKHFYERGYEWCAGFGVLGFEVLGMGLARHMVFSDYYHVALDNCISNAEKNNLSRHVTVHLSPTISGIPDVEKWDLVISNPPHTQDRTQFLKNMMNENAGHNYLDNTCRLLVDQDWTIHKEFFKNICSKLTNDADVYLIESGRHDFFITWAEQNGLRHMGTYPISFLQHGGIFHFKLK